MYSSDNHLNHPLKVGEIELQREVESWKILLIRRCTQEFYDKMQTKDPFTAYEIIDAPDGHMYIGEQRVDREQNGTEYFLYLADDGTYVIYMNMVKDYKDDMIPISTWDDANAAIKALHTYKKTGSHNAWALGTYLALGAYITGENGIAETIIGIITLFGFKEDPRLQSLIEMTITYGCQAKDRDLPNMLRSVLHNMSESYPSSLIPLFSGIYDVFVKYNYFQDKKYQCDPEDLDLHTEISKIYGEVLKYTLDTYPTHR